MAKFMRGDPAESEPASTPKPAAADAVTRRDRRPSPHRGAGAPVRLPAEYRMPGAAAPYSARTSRERNQRRAADDLEGAFLGAITRALSAWQPLEGGSEPLLRDLAEVLGLSAGVLWMRDETSLRVRSTWANESVSRGDLATIVGQAHLSCGVGLSGAAWERCEPLFQTNATARESSAGKVAAAGAPWALVAIPARVCDDVLGVIELYLPLRHGAQLALPALNPATHLLGTLLARWQEQKAQSKLTKRELELLTLASRGLTSAKIAEELWLSPSTVKTHFEHIRLKLSVPDRTAAVAHGLRSGMIG